MINRTWTPFGLLMLVYLFVLLPAGAQVIDYGNSLPKDPAATEDFGIVSYNLSQDGEVYFIELLGAKGPLALCEVMMGEDQEGFTLQEATCDVIGEGHFRARIGNNFAEFENLITGEYSRVHFERVGPGETGLRELAPDEALEVGETVIADGFRMRAEGPLSPKEIEQWGHSPGLVGHALAEVAYTFGFLEKIAREQSEEHKKLWGEATIESYLRSIERHEKESTESLEKESILLSGTPKG